MTSADRKTYPISDNLRWFTFMFVLTSLAASAVGNFATPFLIQLGGVYLATAAVALIAFAIAAIVAADRFAEYRVVDFAGKRGAVALGYTGIASAINLALPTVIISFQLMRTEATPEMSHGMTGAMFGAFFAAVILAPLYYLISWLALGRASRIRETV